MSYPGYVYHPYPKWVNAPHGRMIVQNAEHHAQVTGGKVLPDGTVAEPPKPPTLEEVLKAGYEEPRASQIVAEEQEKFEKGHRPYGDIEPPIPCNMVDVSRGRCTLIYGHDGEHAWTNPGNGAPPDLLSEQPIVAQTQSTQPIPAEPALEPAAEIVPAESAPTDSAPAEPSKLDEPEAVKRGRGRPPKEKPADSPEGW